jgi:LPS sulfotransferase NodH
VGFKLFYYHARTQPHSRVWDHLAASPDITIIHLRRRNLLAQYYSLRLAHMTNTWTRTREVSAKLEPIRLELNECLEHFTQLRALENQCAAFFVRQNIYDLWYEDLVAERMRTMARVEEFLGLAHETPTTAVSRQRTSSLRDVIANYDELSRGFAGTPWAAFTGDDAAEIAGG